MTIRPEGYETPVIQTPCNCLINPTHMTGEQLVSCSHQRWVVKAKQVTLYDYAPYTGAEAKVQQAAVVARGINGELSGV